MRTFSDTRDIFGQLAAVEAPGAVKVVVENHDAWVNSDRALDSLNAAARLALEGRSREARGRVETQRARLGGLAVALPERVREAS